MTIVCKARENFYPSEFKLAKLCCFQPLNVSSIVKAQLINMMPVSKACMPIYSVY